MLNTTKILVDPERKNPFPNLIFLIMNWAYYDTAWNPYWLHTKALNYMGLDSSQYRFDLLNNPDVPGWAKDEIRL